MEVIARSFLDHFDQYGCRFYRLSKTEVRDYDVKDQDWLAAVGLPDGAIPFFFFDFYIAYLRDVEISGCRQVLGTAFEPASKHYLYINEDGHVLILMENGYTLYVNSSVSQLCKSILIYSQWLEEQEEAFSACSDYFVGENQMFDLYYRLRNEDKLAFEDESAIWPQLVHSEINFLSDAVNS